MCGMRVRPILTVVHGGEWSQIDEILSFWGCCSFIISRFDRSKLLVLWPGHGPKKLG